MKPEVKDAFDKQGTHELYASNSYKALAMWCEDKDFPGYAAYFYEQAEEEQTHAKMFFQHVLDRGEMPIIGAMEAPQSDFKNLVAVAEKAQALEKSNSELIEAVYELALEKKDYPAQIMLQRLITEQVEEEDWASSMVEITKRSQCSGALVYTDRHISKILKSE